MRILHFDCHKDCVEISTRKGNRYVSLGKAGSIQQMKKLVERIKLSDDTDICMFSSSMDFPKEYTSNKRVLALVERLCTPV